MRLLGSQDRSFSPYAGIVPVLAIALLVIAVFSIRLGAVTVQFADMASALIKRFEAPNSLNITERIFMEIRLPRALACILVGASLAIGGVLMQALFRNPIVEPGLVGTSSGRRSEPPCTSCSVRC